MKEKVQYVKLNAVLCIAFTVITYLITLNMQNGFFIRTGGGFQMILL